MVATLSSGASPLAGNVPISRQSQNANLHDRLLSSSLNGHMDVHGALERAIDHLLSHQDPAGFFKGNLETNVSIEAEDLMLREVLGIRTDEVTRETVAWIRAHQRSDGTWANYYGGPADLSTTVEAYFALAMAGDPKDAPHMRKAAAFILDAGGIESTRVFTRIWLALFGLWPWDKLPALPPEVMFLPKWLPLNIYDFACWARQTVVPLTIVASYKPVFSSPCSLDELYSGKPTCGSPSLSTVEGWFLLLDKLLKLHERFPIKFSRELALSLAEQWIVRRQEADGSWGGIQPPWVYSLIALYLRGYSLDHPVMAAGIRGLDAFTVKENGMRWLEACQSPVWDTALAITALLDAGLPVDHESILSGVDWLLSKQIFRPGDWSLRRPHLEPGGWAFEFANDNYPDVDDTAIVIIALRKFIQAVEVGQTSNHPHLLDHRKGILYSAGSASGRVATRSSSYNLEQLVDRAKRSMELGRTWVVGMQCKSGGWGAFDVDNTATVIRKLPFCDFGEVIDPPSADVTAHALEMLSDQQERFGTVLANGLRFLLGEQESDGSFSGRWGSNYIYGTSAAMLAITQLPGGAARLACTRAAEWLRDHQNVDGGWGEDMRSYDDSALKGQGESTPSQTAWALLGLIAVSDLGEATEKGVRWLVTHQREDGSWDEPYFTGTGFPGDFYINYHLYRLIFPVMALGRYLAASEGRE